VPELCPHPAHPSPSHTIAVDRYPASRRGWDGVRWPEWPPSSGFEPAGRGFDLPWSDSNYRRDKYARMRGKLGKMTTARIVDGAPYAPRIGQARGRKEGQGNSDGEGRPWPVQYELAALYRDPSSSSRAGLAKWTTPNGGQPLTGRPFRRRPRKRRRPQRSRAAGGRRKSGWISDGAPPTTQCEPIPAARVDNARPAHPRLAADFTRACAMVT